DNGLPLDRFLGSDLYRRTLPAGLSPEAVGALAQDFLAKGRAFVILDGLDEVGDPIQRRMVLQSVKNFVQSQSPLTIEKEWAGNKVLLTSRIVGYQFDP